ncbi:MAG TPA: hypothetical protein H9698_03395 [Candidatus Ruthenibacterium merdavium]|uniref:Integrase SAM-like N-terminal domain-containing protein n=1 Tax=Candidatus Ruthenibacterium merdavium TaxID=2838752 RepID=A0A9D2Q5J3_9FIRM|nr:hypothetical protein [Candidatus Ruthenibacterium merdavium]
MKDTTGARRQKWISTGLPVKGNKARAAEQLRKVLDEYEKGHVLFSTRTSLLELLEEWLENVKPLIEPNTYTNYEIVYRAHLKPAVTVTMRTP